MDNFSQKEKAGQEMDVSVLIAKLLNENNVQLHENKGTWIATDKELCFKVGVVSYIVASFTGNLHANLPKPKTESKEVQDGSLDYLIYDGMARIQNGKVVGSVRPAQE